MTPNLCALAPPGLFLPSLGFFESIFFWQGAVSQDIHHEVGNVGLQATSPILWSVTAPSGLCLFSVEELTFGWEDGSAPSLLEVEVWGHLVSINQKESHHAALRVQREPACRKNHYLHIPVPGKMHGVTNGMFSRLSKRGLVHRSCRLPCLHAQELLRARCSCGRDPPRYSASKYLVSKNLCPLNGNLWVIAGILVCFLDLLKDTLPVMLNWLFVPILKLPLGSRSSSRCRSKLERRRFIGDKAATKSRLPASGLSSCWIKHMHWHQAALPGVSWYAALVACQG